MTHDPMCRDQSYDVPGFGRCDCDLIARVAEREREQAAERVLALDHWDYCDDHDCRMRQGAAAAIRSVTP